LFVACSINKINRGNGRGKCAINKVTLRQRGKARGKAMDEKIIVKLGHNRKPPD
jgi:hypothetical protein